MIFSQTEKSYLAIFVRIHLGEQDWGAWHMDYPARRFYYGRYEPYVDINAAMDAAQRRLNRRQAAYINNPYQREFKIVKSTTLTTYEDL